MSKKRNYYSHNDHIFLKAVIAVIVALIMFAGFTVLGFAWGTNWTFKRAEKEEEQQEQEEDDDSEDGGETATTAVRSVSFKNLSYNSVLFDTPAAQNDASVTKTITATIQPDVATNKKVDATIAWQGDVNEDINNYFSISQPEDGSLTINITCKKSFRGKSAKVTVTSRDGGKTATCNVTYIGEVDSLVINDGNDGTVYFDGVGKLFDITLDNQFNDVGDNFKNNLTVDGFTVNGTVTTVSANYRNDSLLSFTNEKQININEKDVYKNTFHAEIVNGKLKVWSTLQYTNIEETKPLIYDTYDTGMAGINKEESYTGVFKNTNDVSMDIIVKCNDKIATIKINFMWGVEAVNLNPEDVNFIFQMV